MHSVLVVDSVTRRGKDMARAFAQPGCVVFYYDGTICRRVDDPERPIALPAEPLTLVILHGQNENLLSEGGIHSRVTIRFTGGQPPDACKDSRPWIRRRSIDSEGGMVSAEEAVEIADWVQRDCVAPLPSLLCEFGGTDYLAALSVLCEGYLAVCAAADGQTESALVNSALKTMGWEAVKHQSLAKAEPAEVQASRWWLETFGLGRLDRPEQRIWSEFESTVRREWGEGSEAFLSSGLFDLLRQGQRVGPPEIVARTYLQLAQRLQR